MAAEPLTSEERERFAWCATEKKGPSYQDVQRLAERSDEQVALRDETIQSLTAQRDQEYRRADAAEERAERLSKRLAETIRREVASVERAERLAARGES